MGNDPSEKPKEASTAKGRAEAEAKAAEEAHQRQPELASAKQAQKRRLAPVSHQKLRCVFEKDGFTFRRQEGDHMIFAKPGCPRPAVIPTYREIDVDIIKSNMRTAGMTRERYFELLDQC